ncbi:protein artichoke-like [Leptopilina heterotoma]|uniref:protein artichoke-like n=1 Tax=Leptopilina heterotoma TaxID=63436 RepID=UPI001CA81EFD|nr:protein artichoke-like [Leptopilina heterotoma]
MKLLFIYGLILMLAGLSTCLTPFYMHNQDHEKCIELNNFQQFSMDDLLIANMTQTADIKCLHMQNDNIEYIPQSTFEMFPQLQYLNLAGNIIQKRNLDFVSKMQNLKTLVLDKAYRTSTPGEDEFLFNAQSSTLNSLYLRHNGIKKLIISHNMHLENLRKLVLSDNDIREININQNELLFKTNFNWLPQSLNYLHIENNKLTELILINKTNIVEVQARNNEFHTLKLENLPNLKTLLINEELINQISIKNLTKLEDLLLGLNKADSIFHSQINGLTALQNFELECKNLVYFDGKIVDQMPSLRSLFVASSLLSAIPMIKNASNLKYLFLPKNKIEIIKNTDFLGMPNLEELNLSDNLIMDLEPLTFSALRKLKILNIEKNLLKSVSHLSFNSFFNLQKLLLSHNSINYFDGEIVDINPSLHELYLRNNFLNTFPMIRNASNLCYLDLSSNKIQVLEKHHFHLNFVNLVKLVLSFNNISRIDDEVFDNLKKLSHLHLHSNRLQSMPKDWSSSLKNLESVTLEKNEFNDYEKLELNETNFQNTALSYSLVNDHFLYCTLRYGVNRNCHFIFEYVENNKVFYFKKKYMTFKKVANDKLKLIPSAEM